MDTRPLFLSHLWLTQPLSPTIISYIGNLIKNVSLQFWRLGRGILIKTDWIRIHTAFCTKRNGIIYFTHLRRTIRPIDIEYNEHGAGAEPSPLIKNNEFSSQNILYLFLSRLISLNTNIYGRVTGIIHSYKFSRPLFIQVYRCGPSFGANFSFS